MYGHINPKVHPKVHQFTILDNGPEVRAILKRDSASRPGLLLDRHPCLCLLSEGGLRSGRLGRLPGGALCRVAMTLHQLDRRRRRREVAAAAAAAGRGLLPGLRPMFILTRFLTFGSILALKGPLSAAFMPIFASK